ncbi:hypothetical protein HYN56_01325 [Flavobacterium crocinum]|uniref:Uncharacterized protein n=1 Tax=Flavobacterium crocinum TaxID=2183896 RepID=A0A2S1YFV1_9FLAO|nr:hypothetical protein [Flavobacterium crocinum]AWK02927.1 hypothetical protein HYN56_01325 [Flavobacterium crocinum]
MKENLENLYNHHLQIVNSYSFADIINEYIKQNNEYYLSMGITNYLEDEEVRFLNKVKNSKKINNSFIKVKELNIDEKQIVSNFQEDITKSLNQFKKIIEENKNNTTYQSMFIEHDFFPYGYIKLCSKQNFSINESTNISDFDCIDGIHNESCKINYSLIWKNLTKFQAILEEMELDNYISETSFYESLLEVYNLKTFILLSEAFDKLEDDIFEGIDIVKPFFIFANEHDCKPYNIHIYK